MNADVPSGAKFTDTVYRHPSYNQKTGGFYKFAVDGSGHVSSATAVTKSDITSLGIASNSVATTSTNGLLSSSDKTKLSNIGISKEFHVSGLKCTAKSIDAISWGSQVTLEAGMYLIIGVGAFYWQSGNTETTKCVEILNYTDNVIIGESRTQCGNCYSTVNCVAFLTATKKVLIKVGVSSYLTENTCDTYLHYLRLS